MKRCLLPVLLALLIGGELGAGEYGSAARVNGVEISQFRLERHFEDYLREQRRSVAQIRNPTVYKRLKREALEQLIDKELLWQAAQRQGITVADAEVARTRAAVAASFSSPAAFARRLQEAGFDEAGYAEYLRREIAASRMLDQLVPNVTVSDEDVRSFYQALRGQAAPSTGLPADEAQQLALVRQALLEQRSAAARRAALQRLRADAQVELPSPL